MYQENHQPRIGFPKDRQCAVGGAFDDVKGRGHGHMRAQLTTELGKGSGMRSRRCPVRCFVGRSASKVRHHEKHDNLNDVKYKFTGYM